MPGRQIDQLFYTITAKTGGLTRGLESSQRSVKKLVGFLTKASTAAVLFGAVAIAAGIKATRMAAAFDSALREVSTLLPGTVQNVRDLRQELIQLSTEVPEPPELLSKGLYQVISAGISDTAEAMDVLRVAARAASAGLTDTFTSVDAITTVLNAYQLQSSEATRVSDVFFTTIREGKLQFADIAANIGNVATTAALTGVSIEEVGAALATMTKFGINSAEATTALNRFLIGLTQVTDDQAAAAKRLGVEYSLTALQSKGLVGFLQDLEQATGGNLELLSELNPNIRSARAAFVLAGKGAAEYGRILSETNDAQGSTNDAFVKITGSAEAQYNLFKNKVNSIWLEFGQTTLPLVLAALENVNRLLESDTETLIRLLRARGAEEQAQALETVEAERRIGDAIEATNRRIATAARERIRILASFRRLQPGGPPLGIVPGTRRQLGAVTSLEEQRRLVPDIARLTVKGQQEALKAAVAYGEQLQKNLDLTADAAVQLEDVVNSQRRLLVEIDNQVRLQESLADPDERTKALEDEIKVLKERTSILSSGGEATAEQVKSIRTQIDLRENEIALLEARADLVEKQAVAPARTLEIAQQNVLVLVRAADAAAAAGADRVRRDALKRLEQFRATEAAIQRVNDLETAREGIGKDIVTNLGVQDDRIQDLIDSLTELRALATAPLDEGFFLETEIQRTEAAIDLLREGFLQLARLRGGLVELAPPGTDEGFVQTTIGPIRLPDEADEEFRLAALKRRLDEIGNSLGSVKDKTKAVQKALDGLGLSLEDLPPEIRQMILGMTDFLDATDASGDSVDDLDRKLAEVVQRASTAARGAAELAAALGLVGDEAASVVNQVALIAEGIVQIKSGNVLEGLGAIAGGLAGLLSGLFGGGPSGPSQSEIERDESLEANTRRLQELSERMDILAAVLRSLPGNLQQGLKDTLGPIADEIQEALDSLGFFNRGRVEREAASDIAQLLADAGLSVVDLREAAQALGIDVDQLLQLIDGEPLSRAQLEEALEQAQTLFEALDVGLGELLDTTRGRLDLLRASFAILDIDDPAKKIALLADELERAGTALTPAEIQRIREADEEFIEELFRQLQAGSARFTELGAFGELSFDQFLDLLREIEGLQDRIAESAGDEEGDFQAVSAINRLTVEQGDSLLALAGTRNFFLEQIRDSLRDGFQPVQITDRMLAAASSVRIEVSGRIEVTGDAVSDEGAALIADRLTERLTIDDFDRQLSSELTRIRAGFGLAPVREQ